jgi:hypothetical protein
MARDSINRDSVEYVKVPVTAPAGVTISDQEVEIAIVETAAQPIEADWRTATWSANTARVLVGPGSQQLTPGVYKVWVRVTDNPEIPVLSAGVITVT